MASVKAQDHIRVTLQQIDCQQAKHRLEHWLSPQAGCSHSVSLYTLTKE